MLDHLDDPRPYVADDRLRADVARRARQLQRRRRAAVAAVLPPLALAAVGGLWWRAVQPNRVDVITPATPASIIATDPSTTASHATSRASDGASTPVLASPIDVLVVGVDTRADDPAAPGSRGDTILLVRIDPATGARRILSVPRDLYVADPTTGDRNRINALVGDRRALVQAVEALTGVHVDHYIELDFATFAALGDAVGGVDLAFDAPVRDLYTGFEADAGCARLDGAALLRYARSRYLESFDGQRWQADPTSDFGRMARQGDLAQRVVRTVLDTGTVDLGAVLDDVLPHLTVDEGLSVGEARRLVGAARSMAGQPVAWAMIPATVATADIPGSGRADVLVPGDPADTHRYVVNGAPFPTAAAATATPAGAPPTPTSDPAAGAILPSATTCGR